MPVANWEGAGTASELGVNETRGRIEKVCVAEAGTCGVAVEPVGSSNKPEGPALVSSCPAVTAGPSKLGPNGFRVLVASALTLVLPSGFPASARGMAGQDE